VENFKESYHIATVHRTSIQRYASAEAAGYEIETPHGAYLLSFARHEGSMALLDGETGFPVIDSLAGKLRHGSHFPLIFPSTGMVCTIDCMWYLEVFPQSPTRTTLVVGSCFPRSTVERAEFEEVVQRYYQRWDVTVEEDNAICESQQRGLSSTIPAAGGRLSRREANVREIDNWVLDRVLDR
jgi:phenylpropionate dioxygenase-like ring-hydroxylating dioxygenase large terminal subunit